MSGLVTSREGRVLRLTLDRAEKRNALSTPLCAAIVEACEEADQDPGVGAILLEARGPVFCSGMDLTEVMEPGIFERTVVHEQLFTLGARLATPIVAAVQGPALAGGTGLVANAHVVIAAQGAQFGLTEVRIGLWPYVIYRALSAALGDRRTLELSLTGRIFSVNDARDWGLVHEVVPVIELDDRATAVAQHLANLPGSVIARGLTFVRQARGLDHDDAGRLAREMRAANFASEDFEEGVRAFTEKRRPAWPSNAGG